MGRQESETGLETNTGHARPRLLPQPRPAEALRALRRPDWGHVHVTFSLFPGAKTPVPVKKAGSRARSPVHWAVRARAAWSVLHTSAAGQAALCLGGKAELPNFSGSAHPPA